MPVSSVKLKQNKDRVILLGVGLKSDSFLSLKESLQELEELILTAGGEVLGVFTQQLEKYSPSLLMGSGKLQELKEVIEETQSDLFVVDKELSGIQTRNLEKVLGVRVLDRNQVILDIFAQRAQTYEGQLQVHLAQMLDQLPRMVGGWHGSLSRLAGGIGTRGPGESALERDRRRIYKRIDELRKKLNTVQKNRAQIRKKRKKKAIPSFALIGYTNAGKSTLLNKLTGAKVYIKDELFATLDPTTRQIYLPKLGTAVLTDTVGFIRNLPTQLIEAFKATLEESSDADILIHVMDASSPFLKTQSQVVCDLIKELGWSQKPIINVYNKMDQLSLEQKRFLPKGARNLAVSAKTEEGLSELKELMTQEVQRLTEKVELFFEPQHIYKIYDLSREASILKKEEASQGTLCVVSLKKNQIHQWKEFLIHSNTNLSEDS